jgi:hypothetical protein
MFDLDSPRPRRAIGPRLYFKGGGGGGPPKQTEAQKKMEEMQMRLMQAQLKSAGKELHMPSFPEPPPPAPPPPPPPTTSSIDVFEAGEQAKRQTLRRSGYQNTMRAGETGGYRGKSLLSGAGQSLGGSKSLLG